MLPLEDLRALLTPPSVYYRRRLAEETGEPELARLPELMPRGGVALDVGANQGFFAYALAEVADRVLAFEPNPDYALFSRIMLRGKAEVRQPYRSSSARSSCDAGQMRLQAAGRAPKRAAKRQQA